MKAVALSDVAEVFNGKTPSKSEQRERGHPVLKIKDVSENGEFRGRFDSFVDPDFARKFASKIVCAGDTMILNAAHNAGYVGSKSFFAREDAAGSLATGEWLFVRPKPGRLEPRFAHFWLTSHAARGAIRDQVKGIHLYPKDVARLEIPLPALPEQRRIAAILDKADALRRHRRRALDLLDGLTQSLFLEMFGDPIASSEKKGSVTVSDVCERTQIGPFGSLLHESDYVEGGCPVVNPMHIINGHIAISSKFAISHEKFSQLHSYQLAPGDIVLGRRGEMGRCAEVPATSEDLLCGTGSMFLRPDRSKVTPSFLRQLLASVSGVRFLERAAAGVTMANLSKGAVDNMRFMLPPLDEQERFLRTSQKVRVLRERSNQECTEADALFASLQHRAFTGQL